jgi:hypothetical protein
MNFVKLLCVVPHGDGFDWMADDSRMFRLTLPNVLFDSSL